MAIEVLKDKLIRDALKGKAEPGLHFDGGNLCLAVSATGAASWIFRYAVQGKRREIGMGSLQDVCATEARTQAATLRAQLRAGVAPAPTRARTVAARVQAIGMTFSDAARDLLATKAHEFRNAKHLAQWRATLDQYAMPTLGKLDVRDIDTHHVLGVLKQPIDVDGVKVEFWQALNETASRTRGRIEAVINYASAIGKRDTLNPARWRGHLAGLLPKPSKVKKVTHHAALPYAELPSFMRTLRTEEGMGARALQFAILCASRTGEVIGAEWPEIDWERKEWHIPAERMKAGKPHVVPLTAPALALLKKLHTKDATGHVFTGMRNGTGLSNMALLATLKRMKRTDLTAHGFRSTFRDWAGETTHHPREVIEHALAHQLKDKTEAAYQRGTLLQKRRALMDEWARYCG